MEVHEAFEPTDREQRFATRILSTAKAHAEKGSCEPMAFLIADDDEESLALIPFSIFAAGDWNDPDHRDRISYCLRKLVGSVKPKCFAFVSDAWLREFTGLEEIKAAGLDPREYRQWRQEDLDRFMVKREAIFVSVETRQRQFLLTQFYRRDFKDRPIWEETKLSAGFTEGRFVGMLRGD